MSTRPLGGRARNGDEAPVFPLAGTSRDAGQYLRPELVSRACIYKVSGVRRHGQWKEK